MMHQVYNDNLSGLCADRIIESKHSSGIPSASDAFGWSPFYDRGFLVRWIRHQYPEKWRDIQQSYQPMVKSSRLSSGSYAHIGSSR